MLRRKEDSKNESRIHGEKNDLVSIAKLIKLSFLLGLPAVITLAELVKPVAFYKYV